MIKLFKQSSTTAAVFIALSLTGCARFENRMQANGSFDYQNVQLTPVYKTGQYSNDEARDTFATPVLTESQKASGLLTQDIDVRPPTQLIPVIDGVLLDAGDKQHTKIWFNAFKENDNVGAQVWQLLESYLAENKVEIVSKEESLQQLKTGILSQKTDFGGLLNSNEVVRDSSYRFTLEQQADGHSVAVTIEVLSYAESNDGKALNFKLTDKNKQNVERRFANELLEYAYKVKEANELNELDSQPLPIKLGFDDNHQIVWLVDTQFLETWRKLPDLLTLLHFEIVEADKNMGFFLLKFSAPDDEYWSENKLNPFKLENAEYFIQLGELTGGRTSISWLDEDKKPLPDQKITEIYLSITEQVRNVLLQSDKQTKAL